MAKFLVESGPPVVHVEVSKGMAQDMRVWQPGPTFTQQTLMICPFLAGGPPVLDGWSGTGCRPPARTSSTLAASHRAIFLLKNWTDLARIKPVP